MVYRGKALCYQGLVFITKGRRHRCFDNLREIGRCVPPALLNIGHTMMEIICASHSPPVASGGVGESVTAIYCFITLKNMEDKEYN